MKKTLIFLLFININCTNVSIKKPKNLIDKEVMTTILYDLSIMEASRNMGYSNGKTVLETTNYILKKYKIDSLQFARSNQYYASNPKEYKKMFETITDRLTEKDAELTKKLLNKK